MKHILSSLRLLLTLNCQQSSELASASLDRELTTLERWAMRLHQIGCRSCLRFARQLRQLRRALRVQATRSDEPTPTMSPAAMRRIQDAVRRARSN